MDNVEKKRAFLIRLFYIVAWVVLVYAALKYAMPFILPFVLAFLIAFILKPVINKVTAKTNAKRKFVAIGLLSVVYLLLAGLLVVLGINGIVYLGNWFTTLPNFYRTNIEPVFSTLWENFEIYLKNIDPAVVEFFNTASDSLSNSLSNIVSSVSSGAINVASGVAKQVPYFVVVFFLTILTSYFLVVDYYRVTNFIVRQFSPNGRRMLFVVKNTIINTLFNYGRAYFLIITVTFIEMTIGLLILGIPNVFAISLVTALVDIVPVLGTGTILIPWVLYSLVTGNFVQGIGLLILYAVITVVRQIIEPKIVGKQIGLYPLLTLMCMFIGARLFGMVGLFGLPITLTVLVHLHKNGEIKIFKE